MDKDKMLKVRMCIQTYINLYGIAPSMQEMLDWLGASFEDVIPEYLSQEFVA